MNKTLSLALLVSLTVNAAAIAGVQEHIAALQALNLNPAETTLLIIDAQDDFCQANKYKSVERQAVDGSLAVPNSGDAYVEELDGFVAEAKRLSCVNAIIGSEDKHPDDHMSFAKNNPGTNVFDVIKKIIPTADGTDIEVQQTMWPAHCVQNTPGQKIVINRSNLDEIISKGERRQADSYSAFGDQGNFKTRLNTILQEKYHSKKLVFCGIATDYCVEASVNDGIANGYTVYVMLDLCRGVTENTTNAAIERMKALGAHIVYSNTPTSTK